MFKRLYVLLILSLLAVLSVRSQCPSAISSFPWTESFESNDGGWVSGGVANDWTWGSPAKPVITAAGSGIKCWITGGLTASNYGSGEASWIQSPCFDFSSLRYPLFQCKVFWETEAQFDGASLQYSTDGGGSWTTVGSANDPVNCLNTNWYNFPSINYLSPLTATRSGWSGNIQSSSGSCRGGNGSNGWKTAKHTIPALAGQSSVIFRFIFGAGTICNDYDGFAVDDISISEAPPNVADFNYTCGNNRSVQFTDASGPCPAGFTWDFGDPSSGASNTSTIAAPVHVFSGPGVYTVKLSVTGPDNAPGTIQKQVTVLGVTATVVKAADCFTGSGGEALASGSGGSGIYSYSWNTSPVQTGPSATNLSAGNYIVTVNAAGSCSNTASVTIPVSTSCGGTGIYFPKAFTPNHDGLNDGFGAIGALALVKTYRLQIYNRWGQQVFTTTNPFEKWDGKTKGRENDTGIFVWRVEYEMTGGLVEKEKGTVVVIR